MDFQECWRNAFGASLPLGAALRHDYFRNWTRFHALPKSKRYAEDQNERAEILERANTLTTECFGKQHKIWIIVAQYLDDTEKSPNLYGNACVKSSITCYDAMEEPDYQRVIHFFIARLEWKDGSLDQFFCEISEDRVRGILFSEINDTVIAPYDGGFDIISLRSGKLAELEKRYRAWMSDRPDKL